MDEVKLSSPRVYRQVEECDGLGRDHCCWIGGPYEGTRVECPWIERDTVEGRRWACGLFRELGSWEAVYQDPRYLYSPVVQETFIDRPDYGPERYGCGDWPQRIGGIICQLAGQGKTHIRSGCGCTFAMPS